MRKSFYFTRSPSIQNLITLQNLFFLSSSRSPGCRLIGLSVFLGAIDANRSAQRNFLGKSLTRENFDGTSTAIRILLSPKIHVFLA